MKRFLTSYVKMLLEAREMKLDNEEIQLIVNDLMEDDELWDTFDHYINDYLDNF